MPLYRIVPALAGIALLGGIAASGFVWRDTWQTWLFPATAATKDNDKHGQAAGGEPQKVKVTAQALKNLRLDPKPLKAETYWRTLQLPGQIVDRPAQSDRNIVAPLTGVITRVHAFPGDTVLPGDKLVTLRLLSESLHLSQSELFKTTREIQITQDKKKRLSDPATTGAIPESTMMEIEYQLRRLGVAAQAYRAELLTRGLTPGQIDGVAEGKYVSEIEVQVPQGRQNDASLLDSLIKAVAVPPEETAPVFEVQELKVELGQQVQAGQTLCLISNHQLLYIEGRAFRQETALVDKGAKGDWPMDVEFMDETASDWPTLKQSFRIRHIANTVDPASRTFAFFLPLVNQSRGFGKDRKVLLWQYRPGQKVRIHIGVEKYENVFVLPVDALVREGAEAYVFMQNGDYFERKPVRLIFQDREHVVLANDGSVPPGLYVAQAGAAQLNLALKAQGGSVPAGFHVHADGSVHANH